MNVMREESESLLSHGLTTCAGCVMELAARTMLDVLGKNTIMLTPPSCSAILTGYGIETGLKVPAFQSNLENVAAYCSGIRAGLEILGKKDVHVVAFAGDGGTADIGLQALSAAIERGDRFIYVCYDNEAYMNTGIQRSGCTPSRGLDDDYSRRQEREQEGHRGDAHGPGSAVSGHSLCGLHQRLPSEDREGRHHRWTGLHPRVRSRASRAGVSNKRTPSCWGSWRSIRGPGRSSRSRMVVCG